LELSVFNDRPPSPTDWVHFVLPFPGKFQAFCILVGRNTIIEIPMDGSKLKLSTMILSEGDISWNNEVDEVLILLFHLDNPPCSHIRIAHRVLFLFVSTRHALGFSTVRRNVANALANWVRCCWSL
jgi:hypothetical protein